MDKQNKQPLCNISYDRGYNGEIIVLLNGIRYCTVDNWNEYKEAKKEILNQNIINLI